MSPASCGTRSTKYNSPGRADPSESALRVGQSGGLVDRCVRDAVEAWGVFLSGESQHLVVSTQPTGLDFVTSRQCGRHPNHRSGRGSQGRTGVVPLQRAGNESGQASPSPQRPPRFEVHRRSGQQVAFGKTELEPVVEMPGRTGHHMMDTRSRGRRGLVAQKLCSPVPPNVFVVEEVGFRKGTDLSHIERAPTDECGSETGPKTGFRPKGNIELADVGLTQADVERFSNAVHRIAYRVNRAGMRSQQHLWGHGYNPFRKTVENPGGMRQSVRFEPGIGVQQHQRVDIMMAGRKEPVHPASKTPVVVEVDGPDARVGLCDPKRCMFVAGRAVVADHDFEGRSSFASQDRANTLRQFFYGRPEVQYQHRNSGRHIGEHTRRAFVRRATTRNALPTTVTRVVAAMRVGLDVTPLIGVRTGIGRLVAGSVDALEARDDVEVVRFAMTWRGRGQAGVRHRPLPARPLRAIWSKTGAAPITWWTGPLDVVHGTNYLVPPAARGVTRVVTIHDLTFIRFPDLVTRDVAGLAPMARMAVSRGAWVQTDSEFVADEVRAWLGSMVGDRVRAVAPGPTWPDAQRASGFPGARPGAVGKSLIVAIGSVEPRKDLPTLIRAMPAVLAAVPDAWLVLAGLPTTRGQSGVDEALADVGADVVARIELRGYVADADELLRSAAVLAYPSIYEGYGFPPLEAMAAGVPVVATSGGSLPEVLGSQAHLVSPRDAGSLADGLIRVLTDSSYREHLISVGLTRAAAQPSWAQHANRLVELYRDARR